MDMDELFETVADRETVRALSMGWWKGGESFRFFSIFGKTPPELEQQLGREATPEELLRLEKAVQESITRIYEARVRSEEQFKLLRLTNLELS